MVVRSLPVPVQNTVLVGDWSASVPINETGSETTHWAWLKSQLSCSRNEAYLCGKAHLEIPPVFCSFGNDENRRKTAAGGAHVGGLPMVKPRGRNQE